jgi:hypothetical protein
MKGGSLRGCGACFWWSRDKSSWPGQRAPAAATPEELRALLEAGLAEGAAVRLSSVIGQRFLLDGVADARAAIRSRARSARRCSR